ncbi:unnamed protein product [Dracunculus medinensis]|uniref:WD_REPEATS_REGION domain-containing protein n=1 Tax=Dracunculus medinensis TaxID=318479 RepID=A0A0N4UQU9_DRAME|nr:unnamed protein product [Dracunculus medinensis]
MIEGKFCSPRFLHTNGIVQLCLDKSGNYDEASFISFGVDGDVWLWNHDELEDAEYRPWRVGETTCGAVAWHGDNVFIGRVVCDERTNIKKHVVSKFLISDQFSTGKNVTAFALEVLSLDISSSGRLLAAGSW